MNKHPLGPRSRDAARSPRGADAARRDSPRSSALALLVPPCRAAGSTASVSAERSCGEDPQIAIGGRRDRSGLDGAGPPEGLQPDVPEPLRAGERHPPARVIGGDGPPLLLVHGWPENWYAWRHVMPTLAKDYTVIAVDQRGIGRTQGTRMRATTPAPSPTTWRR